jgi:adenine deaminase
MTEWQERLAKRLEAARGDRPVDLLFRGGKVVNVFTGELISACVAVFDGVIVGFDKRQAVEIVDLNGLILSPGFIDGHFHLESTLLVPAEFARAVLPQGTTAVVADPHEIANVAGVAGVQFMLEASEDIGLDIFYMVPSCVPATHLETAGAELGAQEMAKLTERSRILGLAEVMNFPGVIFGDSTILDKLERFRDRIIDGHSPGLRGPQLDAYLCGGIRSDHECTSLAEAEEKLAKGMHIMLRHGSQAQDLEALAPLVSAETKHRCMLVSDDCHPQDLLEQGHMNRVLNRAVELSIDPISAIQLASLNPARYFGLNTLGAVAPGYQADMVVLGSLEPLEILQVYKRGKLVAEDGQCLLPRSARAEEKKLISMKLEEIREEDLRIQVEGPRLRAIRVAPKALRTDEEILPVLDKNGGAVTDLDRDLLKLAVIERHRGSGRKGFGFVRGFGLRRGALASTVAHDSHNLIVVGTNDSDMACAANTLRDLGGGLVAVNEGQVLAQLPLPVAGLMSAAPLEHVVTSNKEVNKAALDLGATLAHPYMALSFLSLPVIPKLKLTDQGLVDVEAFTHVPLFVD